MRAAQILANRRLRYQNLDFKELNSSVRVSCDDYCEAILRVSICGAQGQMSHDLAAGLWISVRVQFGGAGWHESFSAKQSALDDKGLESRHTPESAVTRKRLVCPRFSLSCAPDLPSRNLGNRTSFSCTRRMSLHAVAEIRSLNFLASLMRNFSFTVDEGFTSAPLSA